MKFYSINRKAPSATLREAVMNGLAPDGGLYMPERIPVIPKAFFNNISGMSIRDIAFVVADLMLGSDIDSSDIREIVNDTFSFDIPLVRIDKDIYSLELFHGPTFAFKDVGARFLARVISRLSSRSESRMVKVLLATSGDSGGAVAAGFKDVPGVELFILYPSERLSRMQLDRLNVPGSQVHAIEVLGTFDDCQRLVKEAFADVELRQEFDITSANSINICRLLPQMFYFFHAYASLVGSEGGFPDDVVVSVPSGNLGNLTAGLLAWRMGLPVTRFVVANNANDVTVNYLLSGKFIPRRAVRTVACAMDVGNPSNLSRILDLFGSDYGPLSRFVKGYSYTDEDILGSMSRTYSADSYLLDPHGAAALAALRDDLRPGEKGIFLATAHPSKFPRAVSDATGVEFKVKDIQDSAHRSTHPRISASYEALKKILMNENAQTVV
ncbi:threonine synthase [uncultured Duncaniella sp.]|uniref:threonine synthase n=1 Tax=uncultured Duncaniella sp. TaxID=2768039 RepID=UPI002657C2BD|nr:threonine synthase [uncultured Duncaniella sp.]